MRRRSFLLATAALTLPACSPGSGPRPVIPSGPPLPTMAPPVQLAPPTPDAAPRSFAVIPVWPLPDSKADIRALHQHHLCASVSIPVEDERSPRSLPVVVDLTGPTTKAVLTGEEGTFTTREAELSSLTDKAQVDQFGPELLLSRAVMDDEHAYVVVARRHHTNDVPEKDHAELHLLKIALSNGTVAASLLLHEEFPGTSGWWMSLSLTPDGSTLLAAGAEHRSRKQPPTCFGVRVAAVDLAVQFDARTAIPDTATQVSVEGDALHFQDAAAGENLVVLANGRVVPLPQDQSPFVVGEHCYFAPAPDSVVLRNLNTDEDTALPDMTHDLLQDLGRPAIWVRDHVLFGRDRDSGEPRASAWIPGATTPAMTWSGTRPGIPSFVAKFRDVLYQDAAPQTEAMVVMQSMTSGEVLDASPWVTAGTPIAVSAWGVATDGRFMPATDWFRS